MSEELVPFKERRCSHDDRVPFEDLEVGETFVRGGGLEQKPVYQKTGRDSAYRISVPYRSECHQGPVGEEFVIYKRPGEMLVWRSFCPARYPAGIVPSRPRGNDWRRALEQGPP